PHGGHQGAEGTRIRDPAMSKLVRPLLGLGKVRDTATGASCAVTARDWPFIARSGVISVRTRVAVVLLPVLALAVGLSTPAAAASPAPISAAPPPPRWMRSVSEHATAHWPRRPGGSLCPHDAFFHGEDHSVYRGEFLERAASAAVARPSGEADAASSSSTVSHSSSVIR